MDKYLQGHDLFPIFFFGSTPIVPHTSSVDVPLALSQKMSASLFGGGQQPFSFSKKNIDKLVHGRRTFGEGIYNESITSGLSFVEESN